MLAVACCGNDDNYGLDRLARTCCNNVDLFFYIDGPFKNYKGKQVSDISVPEAYSNMIYVYKPKLLEHEKRQVYLDLCKEYGIDYLLIIDNDEYVHPDSSWDKFREERESICNDRDHLYYIKNYTEINTGESKMLLGLDQPRLIKNPSQVHYLNQHHYQFAINGTNEAITAKDTLYSIKLCHDPSYRSQKRKDNHDRYIKWLTAYERAMQGTETELQRDNRERSVSAGH